jgi:hypothetical protein
MSTGTRHECRWVWSIAYCFTYYLHVHILW